MKNVGGEAQVDPLFYNSIPQLAHNLWAWSSLLFAINATEDTAYTTAADLQILKTAKTQINTKQTNNPKMENRKWS